MIYAFAGQATSPRLAAFAEELGEALVRAGFAKTTNVHDADLVLNLIDASDPKPFRRRSRGTFAAAIHELPEAPDDILRFNYPLLVRALANQVALYVPDHGVWFTTPERGHYAELAEGDERSLAERVVARLVPLATARLVIDNDYRTDLEPELWDGDDVTEDLRAAGARLGDLDLLPAPFPVEQLLDERDLRQVKRLYGIGGLSYGNLSARKDEQRFWMSASGVDKSKLEVIGRDILLVSDYDEANGKIVLSVPPMIEPRRVSVDAIEHWMIYQAHPEVGAILHVHCWMEDIPATEINYPCGTEELAVAVSDLVASQPDPAHAVIGLRNHGITVTGETLTEILDRIEPRVIRQVPMS
ncbi:MAG: class II aldolase/adducin family protein [Thermoleophilia bacterium]